MTAVTVIDNEFATLLYYPDFKIVHHQFHKPASGESFRAVLLTGIGQLKEHTAHKWLSDDRGYGALPQEDTDWAMTTWFPQAKEAGWQVWALVVPPDALSRMNLSEFVFSYAQQGLRVQVFTDPDVALRWLESV